MGQDTINPNLTSIDDCLYRVAVKALITQDSKVLLVKEIPEGWWGVPGGGVDYGEQLVPALKRELGEELGLKSERIQVGSIVHITIGTVVDNIPRLNIFYDVNISDTELVHTEHVSEHRWFTKEEFLKLNLSPSYDNKEAFAAVIFK